MGICGFGWANYVIDAATTIDATDTAGNLAAENVRTIQIPRFWGSTVLTATLKFDLGFDRNIGVLGLRFPRRTEVPTSGTVRWRLDANGGTPGAGSAYDSAAIALNTDAGYGYHSHWPAATQTARYVWATFAVSGITRLDVGHAWISQAFRPAINPAYPLDDGWLDPSIVQRSAAARATFVDRRECARLLSMTFESVLNDEKDQVREILRVTGVSSPLLFCLDPDMADARKFETVIGLLRQANPLRHWRVGQRRISHVIEELL